MSVQTATGIEAGCRLGDRFTVGELIGRGGSAHVYRAVDELLGREVALKIVDGPMDEARAVRLTGEMRALASVAHPGVVPVYDVGWAGDRAYIVMQYVPGGTVARRLRTGPMEVGEVVALGIRLCAAIAHVHAHGVVHRDVNPGNVLLDEGRPLLADFGIAASTGVSEALGPSGDVEGTAAYLSPEQVRGAPLGPATDVYALGLVLLECLTGRREYTGEVSAAAVARLHRRPLVPSGLPGGLAEVLEAMTADDPDDRPDAAAAGEALQAVAPAADRGGAPRGSAPVVTLTASRAPRATGSAADAPGPERRTPPPPPAPMAVERVAALALVGALVAVAVALAAVLLWPLVTGGPVLRGAVTSPEVERAVPPPAGTAGPLTLAPPSRAPDPAPVAERGGGPVPSSVEPTSVPTSEPTEPTEPTEPSEPTEPTEPTEPSEPSEPTVPTTEPTVPTVPTTQPTTPPDDPPSPCPPGVDVCIPRGETAR